MNVTNGTPETRIVKEIRLVKVENLAAIGHDLLMSGSGVVKVVRLAKGGYSVNPLGKSGIWRPATWNTWTKTLHVNGIQTIRVDSESCTISSLFD